MKTKLLVILTFLCLGFFANELNAQSYKSAIGARLGYPVSVSYKQFVNEKMAFEAYAGTRGWVGYRWVNVSGALQLHTPIPDVVDGLSWYYGAGASVYLWNFSNTILEENSNITIGLQGYLGLDYVFADYPVNLSFDWVPTIFLNGLGSGFGAGYGSLGVRYTLNKSE